MKKLVIIMMVCTMVLTSCQEETVGDGLIVTKELAIDNFQQQIYLKDQLAPSLVSLI